MSRLAFSILGLLSALAALGSSAVLDYEEESFRVVSADAHDEQRPVERLMFDPVQSDHVAGDDNPVFRMFETRANQAVVEGDPAPQSVEDEASVEGSHYCPRLPLNPARPCDPSRCRLPNCRCSGNDIPGGLSLYQTPMFVSLSFQAAVTTTNIQLYRELFQGRSNPNGCPATGTFFVSSYYTDFYDVQTLYSQGHEIANNAAVEKNLPNFWDKATCFDWCRQIDDNRDILSTWAQIPRSSIQGFRTPYLFMGGNTQFQAYKQCGVRYDGTRVARNARGKPDRLWPYSYDYLSTQDCTIGVCPNATFPGVWQMPLEALSDSRDVPCADLGGCSFSSAQDVYNALISAFEDRRKANKAPMMIAINSAFIQTDYKLAGLKLFLDHLERFHFYDTFVISAQKVLDWVQRPQKINPRYCPHPSCYPSTLSCPARPRPCAQPNTCYYDNNRKFVPGGSPGIAIVTHTCASRCPGCYPTLDDPQGTNC